MAKKRNKKKESRTEAKIESQSIPEVKKSRSFIGPYIALFLTAFILYGMTYDYGYVLDDVIVYTENNFVKKGVSGISDLLTTESFEGYFGEQKDLVEGARYRPLSLITFAIEYDIWKQNPGGSHLINILLYALAGLLLFNCLRLFRIEKSNNVWISIPFIAALLFLLHPLHVEAVANIKGRDEILSFIGSFAALYFSFKYVDSKKWRHLILAMCILFLGLLAKENTITFLAIIPLSIYFFRKVSLLELGKITLALLIPTLLYLLIRYQVIGYFLSSGKEITDVMNNPFVGMSFHQKYATISHTLGVYLKLHFFPHPLTHDYYPYHIPISTFADARAIIPAIFHLLLLGLGAYGFRKKKMYAYCIFFYLITLSIVSNVFVGVGTFMNERFVFIASVGYCIFAAYYLYHLQQGDKIKKWISYSIFALLIVGFVAKSAWRIPAWKDPLALNGSAIKVSKNSARINSFMATALFNKYKVSTDTNEKKALLAEAKVYAQNAIRILPFYQNGNLMKVGIASEEYKFHNDLSQLLEVFKEVIQRRPDIEHIHNYLDYLNKRGYNGILMDWYYDVAKNVLLPQRNNSWALHYLNYAYKMDQNDKRILNAIADGNEASGNKKAAATFRKLANE